MFEEGVRDREFLVGYSGDNNLTRSAGWIDTSHTMQSGTPVAIDGASKKVVAWNPAAAAGSGDEVLVGLLLDGFVAPLAGDVAQPNKRVAYVSGGPQAVTDLDGRIPIPAGVTRPAFAALLRALGITLVD